MIKGMFSRKPTGNFSSRKEAQKKKYFFCTVKNFPQIIQNTKEIIQNMSEII